MKYQLNEILERAEKWLENPVETSLKESIDVSNYLVESLKKIIRQEGVQKKIIGSLISRILKTQKDINSIAMINWTAIGDGFLSIGHRPSSKLGLDLKLQNATHILTLLSNNEGGQKIQSIAKINGIEWLWFPMATAKPLLNERLKNLAELYIEMESILKNKGKIYIHCSAGIHRTGMISYSFLRFIGNNKEDSKMILKSLRDKTSEGVGDDRLEWANSIHNILQDYKNNL